MKKTLALIALVCLVGCVSKQQSKPAPEGNTNFVNATNQLIYDTSPWKLQNK